MIGEILLSPLFLISAVVILGGSWLALHLTARQAGGGPWKPAQKPANEATQAASPVVTFKDVAGLDDAIGELREMKEYLTDPERFRALGAQLPSGVLLAGSPGCGKTLLARALAGEAGVPFYYVSAASFVEKFVGVGAARVRQLFADAKSHAPSIVFIDELDAIGRRRNGELGGEREFDNTLNQLLVELDGFEGSSGVLILGATNRPELIDPALLRPGRFDRRIEIDRPDLAGREEILRLHASRRPFSPGMDWSHIAESTAGLSAAELANVVNEASLLAARGRRSTIGAQDVDEALDRVLSGLRTSRLMRDEEKTLAAYHEAGHAVLSVMLDVVLPPRVSIIGRSGAIARSPWLSVGDKEVVTKGELTSQLVVLLGGRAAEINVFGQPSTRAADDLNDAETLARKMVERWAMTDKLDAHESLAASLPQMAAGLFPAWDVRSLINSAEEDARAMLQERRDELEVIAQALVQRETLTATEILGRLAVGGSRRDASTAELVPIRS